MLLGNLPGIGPKSAERITHHLLATDSKDVLALADALRDIVQNVHPCRQCFNLTEEERFKINVPDDEWRKLTTVGDIISYVRRVSDTVAS